MIKRVVAAVLAAVSCLFCFAGCSDGTYTKLIEKKNASVDYIGVREDMTVVSNVYEEKDLKELGLSKDAYFLYGNQEEMFFGEGKYNSAITVKAYNFQTQEVRTCLSGFSASSIAMLDESTYYVFRVREELHLFGYKYFWDVLEADEEGYYKTVSTTEYDSHPTKDEVDNMAWQYMNGIRDYAWNISGSGLNWKYTFSYKGEPYDFDSAETSDPVWNYIHSGDNGGSMYATFDKPFDANALGVTVISRAYQPKNGKLYDNYFVCGYERAPEFLFAEKQGSNQIKALYVLREYEA